MKFKLFKNLDGATYMRRVVYVVMGDSLGIVYSYDTKSEAEAACGSNEWVQEVFLDESL